MRILWLPFVLVVSTACGCGGEQRGAKQTGRAVGETVTDFARGVGSGIDKRLEVDVELSEKLTSLGLSKTIAKHAGIEDHKRDLTVYLISHRPVAGRLIAKAFNDDGVEIGRSVIDVDLAEDDAKYVNFAFGPEMDRQLVERYLIDIKPTTDGTAMLNDTAESKNNVLPPCP